MIDILFAVLAGAILLGVGITEGEPLLGIGMAFAFVAVVLMMRLWRNFWAKHPKLAKAGKTLLWILGIILVIILSMMGLPLIPLAVGAVLLIALIGAIPGMRQREKQKTEEFLDDYRERLHERSEDSRRRDELWKEKRKAARAEADRLEDLARQWERNAQRYGTPSDIQKARYYREQANAAKRKLW